MATRKAKKSKRKRRKTRSKRQRGGVSLFRDGRVLNVEDAENALAAGADINGINENGHTPLINAIQRGNLETIKLLLKKGVDVNKRDRFGRFPLMEAVYRNNIEIIKLLFDEENPNVVDIDAMTESGNTAPPGNTALQIANQQLNPEMVNLLKTYKPEQILERKQQKLERRNLNETMARARVIQPSGRHRMTTDVTRIMGEFLSPRKKSKGGKK